MSWIYNVEPFVDFKLLGYPSFHSLCFVMNAIWIKLKYKKLYMPRTLLVHEYKLESKSNLFTSGPKLLYHAIRIRRKNHRILKMSSHISREWILSKYIILSNPQIFKLVFYVNYARKLQYDIRVKVYMMKFTPPLLCDNIYK